MKKGIALVLLAMVVGLAWAVLEAKRNVPPVAAALKPIPAGYREANKQWQADYLTFKAKVAEAEKLQAEVNADPRQIRLKELSYQIRGMAETLGEQQKKDPGADWVYVEELGAFKPPESTPAVQKR